MGIIVNILVIVAAVTIVRNLNNLKAREALLRVPILGKFVLVFGGCLKRVALSLWGTIVWFFKLPVFNVLAKCIKRIWKYICNFAGEESLAE